MIEARSKVIDWSLGIIDSVEGLLAKEPIAPVLVVKDHRAKVPCVDVYLAVSKETMGNSQA